MKTYKLFIIEYNVVQTVDFIKNAHADQLYGKMPYWKHPMSVVITGLKIFGKRFTSDAVKAALLHDVVEDSHIGIEQIKKFDFSAEVVEAVLLLTKNKALSYEENIQKIINSGNKLAMMVKYCDNYVNFNGDKSDWDPVKAKNSQNKYKNSLDTLGKKIGVEYK